MGAALDPGFVLAVLGAVGACFGAYAAIRADLGRLHERATMALAAANRAHKRIDKLQGVDVDD